MLVEFPHLNGVFWCSTCHQPRPRLIATDPPRCQTCCIAFDMAVAGARSAVAARAALEAQKGQEVPWK